MAAAAGVTKSPQKRRKNSAASDTGPARAGLAAAAADQAVAEGLPKADALAAKDAARLKAMIVELKAKHDAEFAKEKLVRRLLTCVFPWPLSTGSDAPRCLHRAYYPVPASGLPPSHTR